MPFLRIRYPGFPALRAPPLAPHALPAPFITHLHLPHIVSFFTGTCCKRMRPVDVRLSGHQPPRLDYRKIVVIFANEPKSAPMRMNDR